jgi:hypothetical protein
VNALLCQDVLLTRLWEPSVDFGMGPWSDLATVQNCKVCKDLASPSARRSETVD